MSPMYLQLHGQGPSRSLLQIIVMIFAYMYPVLFQKKMIFFMVAEKVIQSKTKIQWVKILGQREIAREGNGG